MTFWTQESDLPWIELPGGYKLVFEAISPTTGNTVSNVSVSEVALYGLDISEGAVPVVELPYSLADDGTAAV